MITKKRLTWSQQPSETGLARVMQGERGRILKVNGVKVGTVSPLYRGWERTHVGWYFVARGDGVPLRNTCGSPASTKEEAVAQCEAYVRACLERSVK